MTDVTNCKKYAQPLVWLDIEATGLDPEKDSILELAFVVTTPDLTATHTFQRTVRPKWARHADDFKNMSDWCVTHHTESGLISDVLREVYPGNDVKTVEIQGVNMLLDVHDECKMKRDAKFMMCGRNVHFDHAFLKAQMPTLASLFGHQYLDVTAFDTVALLRLGKRMYDYKWPHRALSDVQETIAAMRHYCDLLHFGHTVHTNQY